MTEANGCEHEDHSNDQDDNSTLSRLFQALANPVTRHFVELLAMDGRTAQELSKHFDLPSSRVSSAADLLMSLGFLCIGKEDEEQIYRFDEQALARIRGWMDRIADIRRLRP